MREIINASRVWEPGEYPDYDTFSRKWGDIFRYIADTGGRITIRHYFLRDVDAAAQRALGPGAQVHCVWLLLDSLYLHGTSFNSLRRYSISLRSRYALRSGW